jgi:Glycosyltransferase family 87
MSRLLYHGAMARLVGAETLFWLAVLALQEVPRGHGLWTLLGVAILLALIPLLRRLGERADPPPSDSKWGGMIAALAFCAALQLGFALLRTVKPKVIDIGTTTVAALGALAHGANPYAVPVDPLAGGIVGAAAALHGYKYLPVTLAVYAPLVLPFGTRGIVLTNVLLQGAVAFVLGRLAGHRRPAAGLFASVLYLSLPFPAYQLFARGANDLVPVLALLLALFALERRPFWAGVLVGLSIAAKPMPGAAALFCLLPEASVRRRYVIGVAAGLLPLVPFALAGPAAFWNNIVLFNALRPIDDTSWLYGLGTASVIAARVTAVLALLILYRMAGRAPPVAGTRLALALAAILVVFAVGPDMHHNYYLWFIPLYAVLAAGAACGSAERSGVRAA